MLKISFFDTNTHIETFTPLINCVIDYALLKTMPHIDQSLLQFIDVVNLVDLLLHFLHILQPSWFKFVLLGGKKVW